MTPRTRMIVAFVVCFVVAAAVAGWLAMSSGKKPDEAGTGWPPTSRAAFVGNCIEQCRKSPGVTPDKYPLCDRACTCSADEGEKIMTAPELDSIAQAVAKGTATAEQTAKMERLKAAGMSCVMGSAPVQK